MNPIRKNRIIHILTSMSTLVRKGIHFCFQKFIAPRSTGEDHRRHEYILNIILIGFIGLASLFGISLIITHLRLGSTSQQVPIGLFLVLFALFVGLLILSRKGFFRVATYFFLGLYLLITTWNAFAFGVELPMVMISFTIIIIISSILVNIRFSILMTLMVSCTLIILGYLQVSGVTSPDTSWRTIPILISDPIQLSIAFGLITLLTWLSNRETEQSLVRARKSESELKIERDNLELTVAERTREIKSLQAEKVAQLYRSAEFGRLSSGLFHDLMNPLNALIGNIDLMKSNPENLSVVEIYLEKSVSASRRMSTFLDSIRKQINRHALLELFSCDREIIEAVEILAYRAREEEVILELHHLDEIRIFGNPLKFHQIAINLIANAIDAYKNNPSVHRSIKITLTKTSHGLVFEVSDFGSGIPENLLSTIFDPFFTTKDPHHGTGLGLSTTKTIVEHDFNGTISVVSTQGIGSTFTVIIPIT